MDWIATKLEIPVSRRGERWRSKQIGREGGRRPTVSSRTLGTLNRHSFEGDDELNAGDLTIVETGIVGDEQVHAKSGGTGELDCIRSAKSGIAAQLRVDGGGLFIK